MKKPRRPRDALYAEPLERLVDFTFDESVVQVFPDMINRSVPGYATVIDMLGILAARYARTNTRCYDLGCSLGAATLAMRRQIAVDCRIVAVDNSPTMASGCRTNVCADSAGPAVDVLCADIRDVRIEDASVTVMNFTLQFIAPAERAAVLQKIYDGLRPGGVLILSEKISFEDGAADQLMSDLHDDFKRARGYSDLEISQKRAALEKVLITEPVAAHCARLLAAGFATVQPWFQCLNFVSLLAIK
ncbi:MAG: carboxy-S-adenosyl-L-methionine synthase CmoA [Pseudomonadota bacterium]|nr:MAG: carboxy-S-adenosyl-L-methionine synthase CmoA [Pseudomonadota bacterium]